MPASGMVAFELKVKNKQPPPGPGQPKPTLQLKSLQVSFPGSDVPLVSFTRNESIAPSATETLYLDEDRDKMETLREAIRIPADAPATIEIALTFQGFTTWKGTWPLAAHVSPTPEGSYGFPFRADDLGADVFIQPNSRHAEGGQHFAYDIHAIKYDFEAEKWRDHSDDGKTNEGRYIWGRQIHAVADGIVLHAEDKWEDNARPGDRKLLRGSIVEHGTAGLVSIAGNGEDARIFSAVTDAQKRMQLRCFDPSADASSLTFEGESAGGLPFAGNELSLVSMSTTRAVTAAAAGGAMILALWKSSANGATVTNSDSLVIAQTDAVKIEKLSADRIVMARQPVGGGQFKVSVWDVAGADDLPAKATATAMTSGPAALFDVAVLSKTRFVTAVQTAGGKLKVIVWDVSLDKDGNVTKITRGKDLDTGDGANQIAVAATSVANQFAVATRTASGKLGLYYFDITADGVALTASTTGDAVTLVSLILFKRSSMATAVRTADGKLRFTPWSLDDEGVIKPGGQFDDPLGDVTALALTRVGENRAGAAVRTPSGKLKLVIWRATEGNGYTILHGDEIVVYARHAAQVAAQATAQAGRQGQEGKRARQGRQLRARQRAAPAHPRLQGHGGRLRHRQGDRALRGPQARHGVSADAIPRRRGDADQARHRRRQQLVRRGRRSGLLLRALRDPPGSERRERRPLRRRPGDTSNRARRRAVLAAAAPRPPTRAGRARTLDGIPELPEAERARVTLESVLGQRIAGVDDSDTYVCRPHQPGELAAALVGHEFVSAHRRGKFLWLATEDGPTLGLHLGMAGAIALEAPDDKPIWDRFTVEFDNGSRFAL